MAILKMMVKTSPKTNTTISPSNRLIVLIHHRKMIIVPERTIVLT